MIKKKLLLACLCTAVLTGCGNRNEDTPESAALSGVEEHEAEAGETADAEKDTEGSMSEGAEHEAEASETADAVFTFGDKATMNNQVNGRELPIYCVDTEEKKVALSFDAAWGNEDTEELLSILEAHDLHVTFFMTGEWVENYPEDVKAILAAGHDLGNHSENHKNMSQLSDEQCQEELMKVHTKVQELTGYEMFLFRPPYGDYDNHVINNIQECNYYPIQWSIDSLDWKDYGVDDIVKRVVESDKLKSGSIILMHNGAKYTADALDAVITGLQDKGYELVPISQLIYKDKYHMKADGTQVSGE